MPKSRTRNKPSKKKKRNPLPVQALKGILERILPIGIPLLFFGFFFFFLSQAALQFLTRSPYFSIETVEASSTYVDFRFKDPHLMGSLLGRNIFEVNLPELEEEIFRKHPELLKVWVRREFPNRLHIGVTPRMPVAFLRTGELFGVDREGILLPGEHLVRPKDLPTIVGIQERIERDQIGGVLRSKGLAMALVFLEELEELPDLKRYVQTIDVSDPGNLSFLTPSGLEVRVGEGEFSEKLKLFDRTRVTLGGRFNEIKYIDLRFDEVVIGSR